MVRSTHGSGARTKHQAKEFHDVLTRNEKRGRQILKQTLRRHRKKSKKIIFLLRGISAREILKEWTRKEGLVAKKQLREKKIKPFTFYCKLLALNNIFSNHRHKKMAKVGKTVYTVGKRTLLDKTKERDIRENLNEIGATTAMIRKEVNKQERNFRKTLPKIIQKSV